MKRVCAWCQKILGQDEEFSSDGCISHGICSLCAIKVTSYEPRTIQIILDFLREPVFVINGEGVVRAANKRGLQMLGKDLSEVEGELGGDAFECVYAKKEGGCGKTLHCKTCAIRNIIMDTLSTGKGYVKVPAFQNINTSEGPRITKFHISTEKVSDSIFLRIDEVSVINNTRSENGSNSPARGKSKGHRT
jgi:hypothetical protein